MSSRAYSVNEEIAHSITHGVGALASVAGLTILVVFASLYGDAWHIVSASIYGATLIALYLASTLYHGVSRPNIKRVLQKHAIEPQAVRNLASTCRHISAIVSCIVTPYFSTSVFVYPATRVWLDSMSGLPPLNAATTLAPATWFLSLASLMFFV